MTDSVKNGIYDALIKVMMFTFPFLAGVSGWTFTQLWEHEGRIVTLETESKGVHKTLDKIDERLQDIQQQLRSR